MHGFSVNAGSTIGRDHRHTFRNNQDAYNVLDDGNVLIGVVTDGCGSGTHSEVGAQLGARLVTNSIRAAYDPTSGTVWWEGVTDLVTAGLHQLASMIGGGYSTAVLDYLLFTIVGVVADSRTTTFFTLGDGTFVVNGDVNRVEYPNNQPPYLAYALIRSKVAIDPDLLRLQPVQTWPSEAVQSFLLATDGVDDVVRHAGSPLPGGTIAVGPINQFWTNDRYFGGNPDLLSRQLRLIGRDWPQVNPQPGLLHDDTTVIVGRRNRIESEEQCQQSN